METSSTRDHPDSHLVKNITISRYRFIPPPALVTSGKARHEGLQLILSISHHTNRTLLVSHTLGFVADTFMSQSTIPRSPRQCQVTATPCSYGQLRYPAIKELCSLPQPPPQTFLRHVRLHHHPFYLPSPEFFSSSEALCCRIITVTTTRTDWNTIQTIDIHSPHISISRVHYGWKDSGSSFTTCRAWSRPIVRSRSCLCPRQS